MEKSHLLTIMQYSSVASHEAYTHKYVATDVVGHSNELSPVCLLKK